METAIKCIVIGDANRASQVAKMLTTSGVPTLALAHNAGHTKLAERCTKESRLQVVAVYCRDSFDDGVSLFRALRAALSGRPISLHGIYESSDRAASVEVIRKLRAMNVDEVYFGYPIDAFKVASALKQKWFPKGQPVAVPRDGADEEVHEAEAVGAPRRISAPSVPAARQAPLRAPEPPAPQKPVLRIVGTKGARPTLDPKKAADEILEGLQEFVIANAQSPRYPDVPVPLSIVGKHDQVVYLDPRRIKPLPDQPRSEKSPGFTERSLRSLGDNIRIFGQADDILVCPMVGDPDYDAQLIDGERRQRSTKLVGLMVRSKVTEDVTPEDARKLYLKSVIRNGEKEPPTTLESVRQVMRFRGEEYRMTRKQVAAIFSKSETWVIQMEMLGSLDESVKEMLEVCEEDDDSAVKGATPRRLTAQIALQLVDLAAEVQQKTAAVIVDKGMNLGQAKRYVRSVRRGEGLSSGGRSSSPAREFDGLVTFVSKTLTSLDTYLDTPIAEFYSENRTAGQRQGLCRDLADVAAKCAKLKTQMEKFAE